MREAPSPSGSASPRIAWHVLEPGEVLRRLDADGAHGLTDAEARARLARHGPNELEERGSRTVWQILWEQVSGVMILLLLGAAAIAGVLDKVVDAVAILSIVVLFVVLGIVQEYRAQRAIAALKQMASPRVHAVRDGCTAEIAARELVPGDLVRLETGGVVPADCRLLESASLRVQEAALTGESEPVEKQVAALADPELALGDRRNMAYLGTFATYGRGLAVVVATGMHTELGRIATLLQEVKQEPTPLQKRLDRLGRTLAAVAVGIAAFVIGTGLLRGEAVPDMLLLGVSIAVAIVPEGLPAVLTLTLALGAQRMLRRKALIRKLPAVETLGSVTVICSDKTGTLTQNRMTVTALATPSGLVDVDSGDFASPVAPACSAGALLAAAALCNDAELHRSAAGEPPCASGDPTEAALVVAAARAGLDKTELDAALVRCFEVPFDSDRKRMTTVHALRTWPVFLAELAPAVREAGWLSITKGAGDAMLECCTQVLVDGRVEKLEPAVRERLTADVDVLTRQGIRVLGVGVRAVTAMPASDCAEGLEQDLVYLGAIGMIDPPRPEARDAVATCGRAGIRAVMITGDHPLTARTIAAELGIAKPEGRVLTGADLQRMTPEALREVVDEVDVYARVSPEHKLRIVEALQARGHVVAMTGDGVNDAPALKRADIGVAMGSGTDVAKEAAEMVLVDDDFATIVAAVEEGRVVYDNLRRFLAFSVTGNVGKVLIVALPPLFGMPLLLKPIQILFSNLLTDGLLGLGMGVERPERDVMSRAPISPGEGVLAGRLGVQVAWLGPLMAAVTIGIGAWYWTRGAANWGAMVFTTLAFLQLGRTLATRSFREPAWRLSPLTNRPLLGLWVAALALQLVAVYLPAAQPFFQTLALSATDLGIAAACGVAVFAAMELEKAFVRRRSAA